MATKDPKIDKPVAATRKPRAVAAPKAKAPVAPSASPSASAMVAAPVAPQAKVDVVAVAPAKAAPAAPTPAPAPKVAPIATVAPAPAAKPVPKPQPAAPVAASPKETVMETTVNDITAKTQAFIADANTRAKTAMEKGAKMFEEANEFGKGNIEAILESGKIAAKGLETLGQDAAEQTRKHFESTTAVMKSFAAAKSPTDMFKLQSDFFRQSFDAMVAETSKATEAMLKLAGDVAQPLSNRVALAAEKVKATA